MVQTNPSAREPVVMISSNYHMDRAVRNAGEAGFTHVMRLPAPSGFFHLTSAALCSILGVYSWDVQSKGRNNDGFNKSFSKRTLAGSANS